MTDWYISATSTADGPWALSVTPKNTGLTYPSLRVLRLPPGGSHTVQTGGEEVIVLPLAGSCEVRTAGDEFVLNGRPSVFHAVSDFCYLPRGATVTVTSAHGGRFAFCGAPADADLPARY